MSSIKLFESDRGSAACSKPALSSRRGAVEEGNLESTLRASGASEKPAKLYPTLDSLVEEAADLAPPEPRVAVIEQVGPLKDYQHYFNCTVWQCFISVILVWLLVTCLSIVNVPSKDIEWPDPSSRSEFVKLPKVSESAIPHSAAELWGEIYKRSINLSVEPCDDFFRYVCDGYLQTFVTSAGDAAASTVSSFGRIELALKSLFLERIDVIRKLIHDETKTEEIRDSEFEVFKFFDSCVNSDSAENFAFSRERLKKLFADLGIDWFQDPSANDSSVYGQLRGRVEFGLVLGRPLVSIFPHVNKDSAHLMMEVANDFPFGYEPRTQTAKTFNKGDFETFVHELRQTFSINNSELVQARNIISRREFREIRRILGLPDFDSETELRVHKHWALVNGFYRLLIKPQRREPSCETHVDEWSLGELGMATGGNLTELLGEFMGDFVGLESNTTVQACTFTAMTGLQFYSDPNFRQIFQDHLAVYLIIQYAEFVGKEASRTTCGMFKCKKLNEATCLKYTREKLPHSFLSMIQRLVSTDYTKTRMRYMIATLKLHYAQVLKRQEWIDPESKLNLLKKAAGMVDHIGSPPHLDHFGTTEFATVFTPNYFENILRLSKAGRDAQYSELLRPAVRESHHWPPFEHIGALPDVNAYHVNFLNSLLSPSTMFVFPMYDETLDVAQVTASFGFVLAHEIGHGFGLFGSFFGPSGKAEKLWSPETKSAFKKRLSCLIPEFNMRNPFKGPNLSGSDFIRETSADHNALQVISEAWDEMTEGRNLKFPGVPCLTPKQMFFVIMAYPWCSALSSGVFWNTFHETREHPMNFIRINKGLSHTPAFLEAFKCTKKKRLYPENPCRIFD